MFAPEGTFPAHALAIMYGSHTAPEVARKLQASLSSQVHRSFDWLEEEFLQGGGKFLVGDTVTVANTMMGFSVAFILKMGLGTDGKQWSTVIAWLRNTASSPSYQRAVQKTEYMLG
jgi:glutathione S-transferase